MTRQGPRFTEAARAAAAQKRRERAAIKAETKNDFEVFVLRGSDETNRYTWEIRQFGGVLVRSAGVSFSSSAEARRDGLSALRDLSEASEPLNPASAAAVALVLDSAGAE